MTPEAAIAPVSPRVSVVVVAHNRREALLRLLTGLGTKHQILVVDNGSTDGSSDGLETEFPALRLIRLPKNFGLTKALNIGIRAAEGTFLLLLHDDISIAEEVVTRLADYLETHPEASTVSPLLVDEAGQSRPQIRALPTASEPDPPYRPASSDSAECVLGAAIMYRTYFLRAIRQIDESYGTYGADIELAWQVKRGGKKMAIARDLTAMHLMLPSPVKKGVIEGDRAAGTAAFLGTHVSLASGLLYRLTKGLGAILTFRFGVVAGAFAGQKIDGSS